MESRETFFYNRSVAWLQNRIAFLSDAYIWEVIPNQAERNNKHLLVRWLMDSGYEPPELVTRAA